MKALFIVDVQKGFITKNNEYLVDNINNLIKSNYFDKIIATKFVNKEDSQYIKSLNWSEMFDSPETDIVVDLPINAEIIEKSSYGIPSKMLARGVISISKNTKLTPDDEIYICGTDYDACVLAIGYQLFDRGFAPHFIENSIGTSSTHSADKDMIMHVMQRNFGKSSIIESIIEEDENAR